MTKKDKILYAVASVLGCAAIPLTVVTLLAVTDRPAVSVSMSRPAQWVQTSQTFLDVPEEEYYFTCANSGRKEGTVSLNASGLWLATSEHEPDHWNQVESMFRTKEQAMRSIEGFVEKYGMCK